MGAPPEFTLIKTMKIGVEGSSHPKFLAEGYMAVARGSFLIRTSYEGCGLETLPQFSVVR